MKNYFFLLLSFLLFQPCIAQQKVALPKIENYTKGELEIKVMPFGFDSPLTVGKITAGGTIHLNFPEIHLGTTNDTPLYSTRKMGRAVGMFVCHDKEIEENTESVTAIEIKELYLYKYNQRVGALLQGTEKELTANKFREGSNTLSWFLSSGKGVFKATCATYERDEKGKLDKNKLSNKTSYNISFKQGWNIVTHKLLKLKEVESDRGKFKKRLIEEKTSLPSLPNTINWHLKYWANDEYLEIEQQLIKQKPITKEQYENWLPKKLGKLKRVSYEVGKELKRMPTLNNINLLFEKGAKKATVTIVDCAGSKEAASMLTLMLDMASRDWKKTTDTGYESASKMDDKRVIIEYNEKDLKTMLSYNAYDRFLIKAEAINISPEELWKHLKTLNIETLLKN